MEGGNKIRPGKEDTCVHVCIFEINGKVLIPHFPIKKVAEGGPVFEGFPLHPVV